MGPVRHFALLHVELVWCPLGQRLAFATVSMLCPKLQRHCSVPALGDVQSTCHKMPTWLVITLLSTSGNFSGFAHRKSLGVPRSPWKSPGFLRCLLFHGTFPNLRKRLWRRLFATKSCAIYMMFITCSLLSSLSFATATLFSYPSHSSLILSGPSGLVIRFFIRRHHVASVVDHALWLLQPSKGQSQHETEIIKLMLKTLNILNKQCSTSSASSDWSPPWETDRCKICNFDVSSYTLVTRISEGSNPELARLQWNSQRYWIWSSHLKRLVDGYT